MKLGITGNPSYEDYDHFLEVMESIKVPINMIVTGNAGGVEKMARKYARSLGITILLHNHSPQTHGPNWFFRRNVLLVTDSDNVLVFAEPGSPMMGAVSSLTKRAGKKLNIAYIADEARLNSVASRYGEEI